MACFYNETKLKQVVNELFPDFKILNTDIRNPSTNFVCQFYSMAMDAVGLTVPSENGFQGGFQGYFVLEYPEMHRQVMEYGKLTKIFQYFFESIEVDLDFKISDLTAPDPKRTKLFMAEALNFMLFMNNESDKIIQGFKMVDDSSNQKKIQEEKLALLKSEILDLCQQKAERKDIVKDFSSRMANSEVQEKQFSMEIMQQNQTLSNYEQEAVELEGKTSEVLKHLENLSVQCKEMESQLVNSPDRIYREKKELLETMEKKKERLNSILAGLKTRQEHEQRTDLYFNIITQYKENITEYIALVEQLKPLKKNVCDISGAKKQEEAKLKELMNERSKVENLLSVFSSKSDADLSKSKLRLKSMEDSHEMYQSEKKRWKQEKTRQMKLEKDFKELCKELKIARANATHEKEMLQINLLLDQIKKQNLGDLLNMIKDEEKKLTLS